MRSTYNSWKIHYNLLAYEGTEKEEDRVVVPAVDGINYYELFIFPMAPQRPCQSQRVLYTTAKLNKERDEERTGYIFRTGTVCIL